MLVKVLFDKETLNKNLYTGWGISFLIEDIILFDTGEDGKWLLNNMQQLGLSTERISAVAISHDHWDHTGGLWEILKRKRLKVYGCPNFSEEFKNRVRGLGSEFMAVNKFTEISDNIYVTGEISGYYAGADIAEQAVIIKSEKGISVLTGCSHPGIVRIIEKIKDKLPEERFYLVAGGFHLFEQEKRVVNVIVDEFKKMRVIKVGPTHCSGKYAEDAFKSQYKNDFIPIRVGQSLEI